MANPLGTGTTYGGGGDIPPGETRIVHAKDKFGNIVKTITIYRTERDYVYDLCDAYNAARSESARRAGAEWFVANGALLLGHSAGSMRENTRQIESRTETERARHTRKQLERREPEPAE